MYFEKGSLVSGNWPGEIFFITHPPAYSNVNQNIYFKFQKLNKTKIARRQKIKET